MYQKQNSFMWLKVSLLTMTSIVLMGFTYYLPIIFTPSQIDSSNITIIDDTTRRITFAAEEAAIEEDGLSLLSGESVRFLIASDGGEHYTFESDLDREVQIRRELLNPNDELMTSGYLSRIDWQISRTARGDFRVILTNESEDEVNYSITVTRILLSANQVKLDDLLARFTAENITVEHQASTQQDTIFDELYDAEIADREILYFDGTQQRVDVYIFSDEQKALEAADIIEPGAGQLVRHNGDSTNIVSLRIATGSIPLWWQDGPFLLYTTGPKIDLEQKISTVLGNPLGATTADTIQVRLNNRTEQTLTDVKIQSVGSGAEVELLDILPGISGYQTVMAEDGLMISTTYQSQIVTTTITQLSPGSYSLDIFPSDDTQLLIRPFNDRDFYTATDISDLNWLWLRTILTDSTEFEPVSADIQPSVLRFSTTTIDNMGEAGQAYSGNMGCNGMGGAYYANADQQLLLVNGYTTEMLCLNDAAMESEDFWAGHTEQIYRYALEEGLLYLFATNGNTFVFEQEE